MAVDVDGVAAAEAMVDEEDGAAAEDTVVDEAGVDEVDGEDNR